MCPKNGGGRADENVECIQCILRDKINSNLHRIDRSGYLKLDGKKTEKSWGWSPSFLRNFGVRMTASVEKVGKETPLDRSVEIGREREQGVEPCAARVRHR